ncbi:hypothetical protein GCM10007147_06860 [Nocardiopsis kunsanensis]|uniref:Uncharacterized protein n=1 Tax=Nocardiopsis kunsanensis TaxID=141693 RepID=A0A918X823_9ACTN|nr:hypothetical protein GCM10007147_06860 [Nocardiopsis kunsanensis]
MWWITVRRGLVLGPAGPGFGASHGVRAVDGWGGGARRSGGCTLHRRSGQGLSPQVVHDGPGITVPALVAVGAAAARARPPSRTQVGSGVDIAGEFLQRSTF